MPDTVFRDSSGPESNHVFASFSRKTADEPTGIAPWRTLLCFREVRSFSLLVSDVLVMPYSSGVTIRDGAAGKPIVATGVPSVLEILRPGENSVVAHPDDAEEFLRALRLVLSDSGLCARISQRAGLDVAEYTWKKRVEKRIEGLGSSLGEFLV